MPGLMLSRPTNFRVTVWYLVCLWLALSLCTTIPFFSQTLPPTKARPFPMKKDVAVPMHDGVVLRADILLPAESDRFPTLVYRTPYNKESALIIANTKHSKRR